MPFPLLLAIGAGVGLGKHFLFDMPRAERQRKLAATTQALSPWTHLEAGTIENPDPFKSMLQFGLTGNNIASDLAKGDKLTTGKSELPDSGPATVKASGGSSEFSAPMGPVYGPSYAQSKYPWFNVGAWPGQ